MFYSDDPVADFDRYDAAMAQKEAKLPQCEECGQYVHDDTCFEINNKIYCEKCMRNDFSRNTEDCLNDHY